MSQENKGRTMIGTVAPVIPKSVPPGTPQPSAAPPGSAQPPAGAQQHSSVQQATIMAPGPVPPGPVPPGPAPSVPPSSVQQATVMATGPVVPGPVPSVPPGSVPSMAPGSMPPGSMPPGPAAATPSQFPTDSLATVGMRPQSSPGTDIQVSSGFTGPGASYPGVAGADPDLFVGQELGGYAIKRKLAEGGMGVVFEGEHGKIGRRGAIKVLKLEFCRSEDVVERFRQEARAVNAIRHENIVDIYDFGRDPYGRVFFVMEYLEGEPLSSRIRRGPLPWAEAFPILDQTLRALKAAHDKGFVHRDLKPDNIWLRYTDGRIEVKLLDFGIAKLVGTESPREKLTQTGSVIGTPHYMSPEQINGSKDVDHRTDIYAMGVIVYEMFSGVTPFVGDTLQAIMTGHLFKEVPRLAEIPPNLGVPAPIAEIVDRMLVKDASARYDSVTDVLDDLHDVAALRWPAKAETLNRERPTRPPTVAPTGMAAPAPTPHAMSTVAPRGTGRRAGAIVGGLAAAGLAIAGVTIWQSQRSAAPATTAQTAQPPLPPGPHAGREPEAPKEKVLDHDALRKDAQTTLRASLRWEAEPVVRILGADAVGKIKDRPSVPALTELTEKDPDPDVRGHAGEALGTIGAAEAAPALAKLEAGAPPPLKVWYASALARLGDARARDRLIGHARSKDLAVSFKAGLTLAEISKPGDRHAIKALVALAAREAELNEVQPYAGAVILTKLAALRHAPSRKQLYALLESDHEGVRLAAAEGLGKLGDDAGKAVLQAALANKASSKNQLVAAVAMIPLGEYGGFDLLTEKLGDKDLDTRRLAARALGEIGERKSLPALIDLAGHKDWTVRIAAAAAIVAIVGLDPLVLAQASVDWTKSALVSQDWAVRKAAAGVLADIPEKEAVPLLAKVIADPDPRVRLEVARTAGKLKSPEAATQVATAAKDEKDPAVKEQQVKALGEIGSPVVKDTLAEIVRDDPGRIGVIAAGSLIAVGDPSGKDKLEAAVAAPQTDLRLAAVQAATVARNPIVVPTLKIGLADRVFDVRFTAAEGLAGYGAEKDAAVKVLDAALTSKDAGVLGRAMAALVKLGVQIAQKAQSPAELLESTDPKLRLAAVPIVRALPANEGVPLLRRLVADPDQDVRRAGVEAIEGVASRDKDEAIKLYKPLVTDADPVVRSKASGQLARLVPPPPAPPPPPDRTKTAAAPDPTPAPLDPQIQASADEAAAAATEAKTATDAFEALVGELATTAAGTTHDDGTIKQVEEIAANIGETAGKLEAAAAKVEAAAKAAADAAGASPSPEAAKLVEEAKALAQTARDSATAAREKATAADKQAEDYKTKWTGDPQMFIAAADAAIATGDFDDAKKNLDKAARLLRQQRKKNASLDYSYGQLHDRMATRTADPAAKRKLLQQAQEAYQRFANAGTGPRVQRARDRAAELAEDIEALGAP